jgi:hypothetical protein
MAAKMARIRKESEKCVTAYTEVIEESEILLEGFLALRNLLLKHLPKCRGDWDALIAMRDFAHLSAQRELEIKHGL